MIRQSTVQAPAKLKPGVIRSAGTAKKRAPVLGRRLNHFLTSAFFPVLIIALWQLLSSMGLLLDVILPSPLKVLEGLWGIIADKTLFGDLAVSSARVLVGFVFAALLGLVLGTAAGLSKFVERLIGPIVDVVRQIPLFAWIPLIILWFGIGEVSKDVVIGTAVFVPVFLNAVQGIRGVPAEYIEVARALQLPYPKFLRKVVFPCALPSIFTGVRLGAGHAWMAVVAAEMLGGLTGLGFALLQAQSFLQSNKLIALMAVIGLIGLAVDRVILKIERSALHWYKPIQKEA